MVNRKETNLDGVKAMARTLLYTDINKTAYSASDLACLGLPTLNLTTESGNRLNPKF